MQGTTKVRSSYGPLAYFSDIFIPSKNVVISHVVISAEKLQTFISAEK